MISKQVTYSANAKGIGPLVYGHYGRLEDLNHFAVNCGLNFNGSVVLLKTRSTLYHVGSMVRNVELYGAAAVVLFPDPNSYIISQDGVTGKYMLIIDLNIDKRYMNGGNLAIIEIIFNIFRKSSSRCNSQSFCQIHSGRPNKSLYRRSFFK